MKIEALRGLLDGYGYTSEQIEGCAAGVELFGKYISEGGVSIEGASASDVPPFASTLIKRGLNQRSHFAGLYHYAGMVRNYELQVAVLELLDGFEILGNLHRFVGEVLGAGAQARIFDGIDLPPLGSMPVEWMQMASIVMPRLEAEADPATVERVLGMGLRNLPDASYTAFKERYEEIGNIDAFLEDRGRRHLERLREHADNATPYFNQFISEDVLDFVAATPEIGRGIRNGDTIIETKIPHETMEYLAADDMRMKQYHVCHCPLAKESIPRDDLDVSTTICAFCPSFNARPWEVTFGQRLKTEVLESGLRGGLVCRFAIHLPSGASAE